MTKLCICKICNCGRHKCPHRPQTTHGSGICHLTEYTNRYHPHPLDVRTSCKPAQEVQHSDVPVGDKTTHRMDYIKHPLEKPFVHVGDEYHKPVGEMEGLTSYNKDYVPKRTERVKGSQREFTRKEPGKFDGFPTYRSDYRQWELKPRGPVHSVPAWTAPAGRFEGQSAYTNDYVRYNSLPRQSCKPHDVAKQSDAAMDDQTIYRKHYVPFELAKREPKAKAEWVANKTPLDGLTTFRRDYTPKGGVLTASCKPGASAYASDAPFNEDTTMRNDYKKWDVERPFHHDPDVYVKPAGIMESTTTHNLNYTPKPLEKVAAKRPLSRQKIQAAFAGISNYREDYRPWELQGRAPYTNKDVYVAPKGIFEGIPTYTAHYVPHRMERTGNFKPGHHEVNSGAFDDNTMYRTEYVPKHLEPCPAANIDGNANFKFETEDHQGHKFYALNTLTMMPNIVPSQALVAC